jgi:hypothetical protein
MRGAVHTLPQYAFMAWCLFKRRGKFTFAFTFYFGVCEKTAEGYGKVDSG